jgi:uncharacterized protein (TIGR02246 family)
VKSKNISTELEALCFAYQNAWMSNDAEAVLALFSEDAVLLPHHGDPAVIGKAAVRDFWWPANSPMTTITDFGTTVAEACAHGDVGHAWGRFSLAFSYADADKTHQVSNAGSYLMLFRRQANGQWLISHRMWDDPIAQIQ